jgi:hypothetical protein
MSSNPGDPSNYKGEKCDCCIMNYTMHERCAASNIEHVLTLSIGSSAGISKPAWLSGSRSRWCKGMM